MSDVLRVADLDDSAIHSLLDQYSLQVEWIADGDEIPDSFWGDEEAGIAGHTVYVRRDTPIHSLLHEMAHIVCMSAERRRELRRDAGADDIEEEAVCYLQVLLADELAGVGRRRLMRDMDTWGYSFRVGGTADWFESDSKRAANWLFEKALISESMQPTYRLRVDS
ncbi:MAG: hypothetical protein AAF351_08890 [Pseudomonadota bacterium]